MNKQELRTKQRLQLGAMVVEELKMANEMYSLFRSPMEALGTIQEEVYEAKKNINYMLGFYNDVQSYLCDHNETAAVEVAKKMQVEALKAAQELLQVAAMCEKFAESAGMW